MTENFTSIADDLIKAGIVASFNRPGGNPAGIYLFISGRTLPISK